MLVINTVKELKKQIAIIKANNKTIGLVPTMGYLHEGHISLANKSVSENDITIMSIFVNPVQFGPNEDYETYPRDIEQDKFLAIKAGVDILFVPEVEEMYPKNYSSYVEVFDISEVLCGAKRPGHFKGVCTVVMKLFNLSEADNAYFGQKDFQQVMVLSRMVNDLNININIVVCPIVREEDGLAKSSRNSYLTTEQREQAVCLSKSLIMAQELVNCGERSTAKIKDIVQKNIEKFDLAEIDYIEIVDYNTLQDVDDISNKNVIALAVKFGNTRLIDNIVLEVNDVN